MRRKFGVVPLEIQCLSSVTAERDHQAMLSFAYCTEQGLHVRTTDVTFRTLYLHLDDRRLKTEFVFVGNNVYAAIGPLRRNPCPVTYHVEQMCKEVREGVSFQLFRQSLEYEVSSSFLNLLRHKSNCWIFVNRRREHFPFKSGSKLVLVCLHLKYCERRADFS